MTRRSKLALIVAAATAVVGGGSAIALAATSGPVSLSTLGVKFTGSYEFFPQGVYRGGFGYPGRICDTQRDGNPVFVHARVEGYDWGAATVETRGVGKCTSESRYAYARPQLYVRSGQIEACQDRGIWTDLCKVSPVYRR